MKKGLRAQINPGCQNFLKCALALFREAVADGFKDVGRFRKEKAVAPTHSMPEFQAIVSDLGFLRDPFERP